MKEQRLSIILFISCCIFYFTGYAINSKALVLNDKSLSEKDKIDTLNKNAYYISPKNPDSSLVLAKAALELSKENDYSFGEAEALFNIGNSYLFNLDIQNAIANYLHSSSIFVKTGPSHSYGELLKQIGLINNYTGNYLKAVEYFRKSGSVFEMLDDSSSILNIYSETGLAFAQAKEYDSAFYYLRYALRLSKTMNDPFYIADIYNNMGLVYLWMNDTDPENDKIDGKQAINYLDSSMYYWRITARKTAGGSTLCNLGEAYGELLEPPDFYKAELYCKLGISKLKQTKSIISIANVYAFLGGLSLQYNDISKSKAYLDSSLYLIRFHRDTVKSWVYEYPQAKLNSMKFKYWTAHYAYMGLHEWFDHVNNYDSAMYYYKLAITSRDSINMIKSRFQVDYLQADSENQRLAMLESESELNKYRALRNLQWIIVLTFLIIVLIVLVVLIIRHNKLKTTQEKISLQQKLFRLQLNPHFIFNSLGSIQSIIIDQQNDTAIKYISKFSRLMRNILDGSFSEFTTLSKEINLAENYLDLQKVRFKDKFTYSMNIPDEIDIEEIAIPSFLLQPFIENAIEHGIMHKESHGAVLISANQDSEYIILEVVDDGIGREKANELKFGKNKDHKSVATEITKERLAVLNKKLKQKIRFEIIDLKDEKGNATGTKVVFEIPLSL